VSETNFLSINQIKINYAEYGAGELPLVFVHAGIANSRMWDDQVAALSKDYRLVTYDMRGFGLSPAVAGEYRHYEDLIALLDQLDIKRCVLIGCSKGGGVVFDAALAAPEKIVGLVVVDGTAFGFEMENAPDPPPQWDQAVEAFKAGDLETVNELEVQMWVDGYGQPVGRAEQKVREKVREMNAIVLQNEVDMPDAAEKVLEPKAGTRLGELSVPVLFISGALDDLYILQAIDKMMAQISNADHVTIPNTAHLPNMESPKEFNRLVSDFAKQFKRVK
jgi:pimeloyl-ACP methyl ester carboxylesterase